jgi:hypothetical protein
MAEVTSIVAVSLLVASGACGSVNAVPAKRKGRHGTAAFARFAV